MDNALGKSGGPPLSLESGEIGNAAAKIGHGISEISLEPICEAGPGGSSGFAVTYSHVDNSNLTFPVLSEGMERQCPPNFTSPRREGCGFGG